MTTQHEMEVRRTIVPLLQRSREQSEQSCGIILNTLRVVKAVPGEGLLGVGWCPKCYHPTMSITNRDHRAAHIECSACKRQTPLSFLAADPDPTALINSLLKKHLEALPLIESADELCGPNPNESLKLTQQARTVFESMENAALTSDALRIEVVANSQLHNWEAVATAASRALKLAESIQDELRTVECLLSSVDAWILNNELEKGLDCANRAGNLCLNNLDGNQALRFAVHLIGSLQKRRLALTMLKRDPSEIQATEAHLKGIVERVKPNLGTAATPEVLGALQQLARIIPLNIS